MTVAGFALNGEAVMKWPFTPGKKSVKGKSMFGQSPPLPLPPSGRKAFPQLTSEEIEKKRDVGSKILDKRVAFNYLYPRHQPANEFDPPPFLFLQQRTWKPGGGKATFGAQTPRSGRRHSSRGGDGTESVSQATEQPEEGAHHHDNRPGVLPAEKIDAITDRLTRVKPAKKPQPVFQRVETKLEGEEVEGLVGRLYDQALEKKKRLEDKKEALLEKQLERHERTDHKVTNMDEFVERMLTAPMQRQKNQQQALVRKHVESRQKRVLAINRPKGAAVDGEDTGKLTKDREQSSVNRLFYEAVEKEKAKYEKGMAKYVEGRGAPKKVISRREAEESGKRLAVKGGQ